MRGQPQASGRRFPGAFVIPEEREQRLLAGGVEAPGRFSLKTVVGGKIGEKLPDGGQRLEIEGGFDAAAARCGQFEEQGHQHRGEAAGGHAVFQQSTREGRNVLGEDESVLEAHAHPERHTGDQAGSIVEPGLDDHLHADREQHCQDYRQKCRDNDVRDGQDDGQRLRQKMPGPQKCSRWRLPLPGPRRRSVP